MIKHLMRHLARNTPDDEDARKFMQGYYRRQLEMMPHQFFNTLELTHDRLHHTSLQTLRRDRTTGPESVSQKKDDSKKYVAKVLQLSKYMGIILERGEKDDLKPIRINNRIREWSNLEFDDVVMEDVSSDTPVLRMHNGPFTRNRAVFGGISSPVFDKGKVRV